MESKRLIVSISYHYFALPREADISQAINVIGQLLPVERTSYDGETIYSPDKDVSISFDLIDDKLIRLPTPEEKENKELAALKSLLDYQRDQVSAKEKRINELECVVEQLNKPNEVNEEPPEGG